MFANSYCAFLGLCQRTKQYTHQNFHEMKTIFTTQYGTVPTKICKKYLCVVERLNKVNAN